MKKIYHYLVMDNLFLILWMVSFGILLVIGLYYDIIKRGRADKVDIDKGDRNER